MHQGQLTFLMVMIVLYTVTNIREWMYKDETCTVDEEMCQSRYLPNITEEKPVVMEKNLKTAKKVRHDVCHAIDVLTLKNYPGCHKKRVPKKTEESSTAANVTMVIILLLTTLKSVHDVMREKKLEAARREREPEGIRRRSLAEFAGIKKLRRSSSKLDGQLYQITERDAILEPARPRLFRRGDSSNSYLSNKCSIHAHADTRSSASTSDSPAAGQQPKKPSPYVFGVRPVPMVRRCSYPALPINPDIKNLIHQFHQDRRPSTCDSDEESDGKTRHVRLIRRH